VVGANEVAAAAKWAWDNRAAVTKALSEFRRWLRRSRILVVGPGGTGKTTLARILCGEFDWLKDSPWQYDEDVEVRRYQVKGGTPAEVVVLPAKSTGGRRRGRRSSASWRPGSTVGWSSSTPTATTR
jgi:hypothetical protein